jgi:hypothetical protein
MKTSKAKRACAKNLLELSFEKECESKLKVCKTAVKQSGI